jgi:hypothetical protein
MLEHARLSGNADWQRLAVRYAKLDDKRAVGSPCDVMAITAAAFTDNFGLCTPRANPTCLLSGLCMEQFRRVQVSPAGETIQSRSWRRACA